MPKVPKDIRVLQTRTEAQLQVINDAYRAALGGADFTDAATAEIKNLLENERSMLDYLAVQIRKKCCRTAPPLKKVYFPIATKRSDFEKWARQTFPGLEIQNPDLWNALEKAQPYPQRGRQALALADLRELVNRKKHVGLIRQRRLETPIGQRVPPNFGPAVFRKSDFGASPADDAWIGFRFVGMKRSALWTLGRIHRAVEDVIEGVVSQL